MTKQVKKSLGKLTKNLKSFSLVELIIVIAIIAILSVAGFMTLTKWIGKSRNSRRISDLKNIEKALTINYTEKGKYPTPSNNGGVNYSGSTLWKQGTFGKETIDKMDEFTTVPKDPLTKTGYDYSVTENQKKYEISAAMESVGIAYTDIRKYVDKVYAGDYYSKVLGNYDSLSLGVKTGANNCYTLSIPSIIISDFTGNNIEIKADGSKEYNFVMEGGKNIGPSYKSALKKTRKGTKFGVKSVYSKCEIQNLTDFNDFSSGLHLAYSGEKITETPSFDYSIGDIGNSDEDVEVRTESYKELEDSDIITLSNDVSEEIGNDINGSEESGGGKTAIDGSCGSATGTYAADNTDFVGDYCNAGNLSGSVPSFPSQGGSVSWYCEGENGGNNSSQCIANRETGIPEEGTCENGLCVFNLNAGDSSTDKKLMTYQPDNVDLSNGGHTYGDNVPTTLEWGCYETDINGDGGSPEDYEDGASNTQTIADQNCADYGGDNGADHVAADYCNQLEITVDGYTYDDWYLPAGYELHAMCAVNSSGIDGCTSGSLDIGGKLGTAYLWSSTERDGSNARYLHSNGYLYHNYKINSISVQCVRSAE